MTTVLAGVAGGGGPPAFSELSLFNVESCSGLANSGDCLCTGFLGRSGDSCSWLNSSRMGVSSNRRWKAACPRPASSDCPRCLVGVTSYKSWKRRFKDVVPGEIVGSGCPPGVDSWKLVVAC